MVYQPDPADPSDNVKRSAEERDALFDGILARESWVIEDAGRACFVRGMEEADVVILLEPPAPLRDWRILRRWVRQRLGRESCGYRPDFLMLRLMFRWRRNYDSGKDGLKERLKPFSGKLLVLRSDREVREFLQRITEEGHGRLSGASAGSGE